MPADLSEPLTGLDSAASAIDTLETTHEEFEDFFGDVFDQLQSLSLELFARHKCLELTAKHQAAQGEETAEQQRQFQQLLDELNHWRGEMQRAAKEQEEARAQLLAAHEKAESRHSEVCDFQEEFRRAWSEFHAGREDAERERDELRKTQQTIEEHLARLAAIAAELADVRSQAGPAEVDIARQEKLEQMLEETSRQRAAWEHERASLESELELVRSRAAELAETLAEQRRQSSEHQAALAGELKRMRSLLEAISGRMQANAASGNAKSPATADDPVLDSVLAQFEMLQRDISERRACKSK